MSLQTERGGLRVRPVQGGHVRSGGDESGRLQGLLLLREDLVLFKPREACPGKGERERESKRGNKEGVTEGQKKGARG